ncbi:MAG: hypothetical protein KDK05_05860 [Candidatus Competibacteraceae bacterium]|nr:hypothetical protein [Candidatus Competibacteraceae bacterium]MCB1803962.1 hypothetical protein [Candidatus Competibacteraceae bacterium]
MDKKIVTISGITINNHPAVTSVDVMQKAYGNEHTRAAGWYYLQGQNFCSDYFEYQDDVWQYLRDNAQTSQPVIGQIDTLTGLPEQAFTWNEPRW